MRTLTALAAIIIPAQAIAATIPISGSFGTLASCSTKASQAQEFLMRPDGLYAIETQCKPTMVRDHQIRLSCAVDDPKQLTVTATIIETGDLLHVHTDVFGSFTLHRCR